LNKIGNNFLLKLFEKTIKFFATISDNRSVEKDVFNASAMMQLRKGTRNDTNKGGKECGDMRIEAYNQVAQLYQTSNTKNTTQTAKANGMGRDEVQISSTGKDYHVAKAAVAESADIREDLVADIKSRIQAGTYEVSADDFAEKLLNQYGSIL